MADLFEYIKWRGDLPFTSAPFCDADALVLSRIAYLPFDNLVSAGSTLGEVCRELLENDKLSEIVLADKDVKLTKAVAENRRFAEISISSYENKLDRESEMQFSAAVYGISEKLRAVFFRGTDNTLVGWREDFNMSYSFPVPSQTMAKEYLLRAAKQSDDGIRFIVGGHSKGGNLAVYASSMSLPEVKERIDTVYSLDGPGFGGRILDIAAEEKIRSLVPQTSLVGMILGHDEKYTVVHSTATGLLQHDLYSWQTVRDGLERLTTVTKSGQFLDKTLSGWLSDMDDSQRKAFTDALFTVLGGTGADSFKELSENKAKNALSIAKTFKGMDEHTRKALTRTISLLISNFGENISLKITPKKRSAEAEITVSDSNSLI